MTNNILIFWNTQDGEYTKKIGCIVNFKFEVLCTITSIFNKRGDFSDELVNLCNQYNISLPYDYELVCNMDDYGKIIKEYTPEEASLYIKRKKKDLEEIDKYLTPEKTEELISLFNNKK